jgi:hypothetical protein
MIAPRGYQTLFNNVLIDRLMNIIDQLEQLAENLMQTVLREAFEY